MKVVVVNYVFDPRLTSPGALLSAYDSLTGWCDGLARAGASVRLAQAFPVDADVTGKSGASFLFRAVSPHWRGRHRLHAAIAEERPDIVHVNGLDSPLQTWRLRQLLPRTTAIVAQDHGGTAPAQRWSASSYVKRRLLRGVDGFLFTAPELAEPWLRAGCIADSGAVHAVLEASTNLEARSQEAARAATGLHGSPAVLWVGRLSAVKDPLTVLDGFALAVQRLPSATLTMIFQESDLLEAVRDRIAASHALRDRVTLLGKVPHDRLADWYSAADLFVLGSTREVCGFAALEACACGAVPLLTDIPAFRTLTAGGNVGALWECGDAAGLADAVVTVANRNLSAERRRVLEHFESRLSWTAVAERALAIYETVVARRRGSTSMSNRAR